MQTRLPRHVLNLHVLHLHAAGSAGVHLVMSPSGQHESSTLIFLQVTCEALNPTQRAELLLQSHQADAQSSLCWTVPG